MSRTLEGVALKIKFLSERASAISDWWLPISESLTTAMQVVVTLSLLARKDSSKIPAPQ
jgi:hypothetical protein